MILELRVALFSFLISVHCTNDGVIYPPGPCPNYEVLPGFDSQLAYGQWYGIVFATQGYHLSPVCHSAFFEVNLNGLLNVSYEFKPGYNTVNFTMRGVSDGPEPGRWTVRLSYDPNETQTFTILAADYAHYMTSVQCKFNKNTNQHINFALVLSRSRTLSNELLLKATKGIQGSGIYAEWHALRQQGC